MGKTERKIEKNEQNPNNFFFTEIIKNFLCYKKLKLNQVVYLISVRFSHLI
jgi:hypothetical protein